MNFARIVRPRTTLISIFLRYIQSYIVPNGVHETLAMIANVCMAKGSQGLMMTIITMIMIIIMVMSVRSTATRKDPGGGMDSPLEPFRTLKRPRGTEQPS